MSITALLSSLLLASAPAPDLFVHRQEQATQVPDIEVVGRPTAEQVRTFVREVAAPPRGRGLARWEAPVCAGTVNLDRAAAQPILDRIALAAADLDLRVGEPGCDPNLVIVFTTDGAGMANAMVERDREVFDNNVGALSRGDAALEAFRTSNAPVRWWSLSMPFNTENGERAIRIPGENPSRAVPQQVADQIGCGRNPQDCPLGAPIIQSTTASRLRTQIADALYKTIVIVDVDQLGEVDAVRLGDYLAFVSLAQISGESDTSSFDTVLNLFDGGAPDGLTEWDRSYLQALYRAPPGERSRGAQAGDIMNIMTRDRVVAARGE